MLSQKCPPVLRQGLKGVTGSHLPSHHDKPRAQTMTDAKCQCVTMKSVTYTDRPLNSKLSNDITWITEVKRWATIVGRSTTKTHNNHKNVEKINHKTDRPPVRKTQNMHAHKRKQNPRLNHRIQESSLHAHIMGTWLQLSTVHWREEDCTRKQFLFRRHVKRGQLTTE